MALSKAVTEARKRRLEAARIRRENLPSKTWRANKVSTTPAGGFKVPPGTALPYRHPFAPGPIETAFNPRMVQMDGQRAGKTRLMGAMMGAGGASILEHYLRGMRLGLNAQRRR